MSTLIIEFEYFLIMPEATIVILDNSEYSINGDYEPTRWMSQIDAAGLLIQTKLEQSHQNAMGIALSAGKHAQIICTPSNDITKVTSYLYGIKLHGNQKLSVVFCLLFRLFKLRLWHSNIGRTPIFHKELSVLLLLLSLSLENNSS